MSRDTTNTPLIATIGSLAAVVAALAVTLILAGASPIITGIAIGLGAILVLVTGILIGLGRSGNGS